MKYYKSLLIPLLCFSVLSACSCEQDVSQYSLIYSCVAPAKGDKKWTVYEDSKVKMVSVSYGSATKHSNPGFFVYRKATENWIRIDKISTQGATFGRSPTLEEANKSGKGFPSINWNFQELENDAYIDFPLQSAGFLFFPDEVELDKMNKEYILRFNSDWEIEGVETVIRLPVDELLK